MKNRYEGWCDKCCKKVKRMEGETMKRQGAWFVKCSKCAKVESIEAELMQRALVARNDCEKFVSQEPRESYDTSQMNLRFERSRHGG